MVQELTYSPYRFIEHKELGTTGSSSTLYEPHKGHNMASNYKGLNGIFATRCPLHGVVKVKIPCKNRLPYSIHVSFSSGVVILLI